MTSSDHKEIWLGHLEGPTLGSLSSSLSECARTSGAEHGKQVIKGVFANCNFEVSQSHREGKTKGREDHVLRSGQGDKKMSTHRPSP